MTRCSPLELALFLAAPLAAQNPPPRHVVHGAVFDSVAQAPLAGAVVQIAPRDATGPLYSATTDSTGHFRIADLPAGQFLIGFYHDALRCGRNSPTPRDVEVKPRHGAADRARRLYRCLR